MSGFVAIINTDGTPIDRKLLEELTASLYSRGPDRQEVWIEGSTGLGHTLFRTTDEARHENQPASLDGRAWITGCIRIDAREDLLNKLGMQRDIRLAETPDSHLVLHAYRAWGEQCLDHLLGDFSFALWDSEQRKLFCARDRFGLRQLVYAQRGNTFIISNSIHCIRQHPAVSDQLCEAAIGNFLLFGDHRWGDRSLTAFADIKAVEPAHYLSMKNGELKMRRYWHVATDVPLLRYHRESEYADHFGHVFKTAVADRLRTPEIVISLSGGMDSSSIAAVIGELQQKQNPVAALHAASVLYDSIHPSDERYYLEQVSRHLKIKPHYINGGAYPLLTPYVQTTCPLELYQPQLWLNLYRHALTQGRVMLNGDGGDELLKSSSFKHALKDMSLLDALAAAFHLRKLYGTTPALGTGLVALKRRLFNRSGNDNLPYPYPDWINPDFERKLDLKQRWSAFWSEWQSEQMSMPARHQTIAKSIMQPDWNTDDYYMNCGSTLVEMRSPFLDPRLVDLVMSLPALPWLFNKHLLRRAMRDKLPKDVLRRPKTALGNIHESLLKQNFPGNMRPYAEMAKYVDQDWINTLPVTSENPSVSYVNFRPLLLNTWLEGLDV